jgi:hypothetical protein
MVELGSKVNAHVDGYPILDANGWYADEVDYFGASLSEDEPAFFYNNGYASV